MEELKEDLEKIRVNFTRLRDQMATLMENIEKHPEMMDEIEAQGNRLEIEMMEQQSKLDLMNSLLDLHPPKEEEEESNEKN